MNNLTQTTEMLAYIDPGILSIVLQVVAGVVFALLVSAKVFWSSIRSFFKNVFFIREKSREAES